MKVKIEEIKSTRFVPFNFILTVETEKELLFLYNIFSTTDWIISEEVFEVLKKKAKEAGIRP